MALTLQQLQAQLDAVQTAIGDVTARNRTPDGRESQNRSIDELRKAEALLQELIRQAQGGTGSRVRLAQHKRGDVPLTPTTYDRW